MTPGVRITKLGIVVGIVIVLILLFFYIKKVNSQTTFYTCTQLEASGHSNIPKGNPLYQARLDRNSNNIACEL